MSMEEGFFLDGVALKDRKSTRLNSSHSQISYAVFCLKKKKQPRNMTRTGREFCRLPSRSPSLRKSRDRLRHKSQPYFSALSRSILFSSSRTHTSVVS